MACKYQVGLLQFACQQWMRPNVKHLATAEVIPTYARAIVHGRTAMADALRPEAGRTTIRETRMEVIDSLDNRQVHELWTAFAEGQRKQLEGICRVLDVQSPLTSSSEKRCRDTYLKDKAKWLKDNIGLVMLRLQATDPAAV